MFLGIKTVEKFRGKNPIYNRAFVINARENRTLINKLIKKLTNQQCDEDILKITNQLKTVSIRLVVIPMRSPKGNIKKQKTIKFFRILPTPQTIGKP
jgi:hypothetical protein